MRVPDLHVGLGARAEHAALVVQFLAEQFDDSGNRLKSYKAAITLIGPSEQRLRAWELDGAFPVKWTGPDFKAHADGAAIETIEIAHQGLKSV